MKRTLSFCLLSGLFASAVSACSYKEIVLGTPDGQMMDSSNDDSMVGPETMTDTSPNDASMCPAITAITTSDLSTSTTWDCPVYRLESTLYVNAGATLTIAPGTQIRINGGRGIVVLPGGRLLSQGTQAQPIRFTSSSNTPAPGQWAGVVLVGDAAMYDEPIVGAPSRRSTQLSDPRSTTVAPGTNNTGSCGTIRYTVFDSGGSDWEGVSMTNAWPLAIVACGSGTRLDFVEITQSTNGLLVFGGSPTVRHLFAYRTQSALTWNYGYKGSVQYLAVDSKTEAIGSILGSSSAMEMTDRSAPQISNVTVVNEMIPLGTVGLGFYTGLTLRNALFVNTNTAATNMLGFFPPATITATTRGFIDIAQTVTFTQSGMAFTNLQSPEALHVGATATNVAANLMTTNALNPWPTTGAEKAIPKIGTPLVNCGSPGAGMDIAATYCGAFAPNNPPWTEGWTITP